MWKGGQAVDNFSNCLMGGRIALSLTTRVNTSWAGYCTQLRIFPKINHLSNPSTRVVCGKPTRSYGLAATCRGGFGAIGKTKTVLICFSTPFSTVSQIQSRQ
eukprot:scaffold4637_cov128-Cylindrotheca_fusiformis.AAC.31